MSYIDATDTSLRKTGQIKLHGPGAFAGMRKEGALVAKCLDDLTDLELRNILCSHFPDRCPASWGRRERQQAAE